MKEDYNKHLYSLLDFIQLNYNKKIDTGDIENLSCYSYRNIQRLFKAAFSETIGSYQQRLRLEKAAKLLFYTKTKISDIAVEVGYGDLQSFRKAFKKMFGIAPLEARKKEFISKEQRLITYNRYSKHDYKEVFLPKENVIYMTVRAAYNSPSIEECWENLFASLPDIASLKNSKQYGAIFDDPEISPEIFCRYDACLQSEYTERNHFSMKWIAGKNYLRFEFQGPYKKLDNFYDQIFLQIFSESKYELCNSEIIEEYIYNPSNCMDENRFLTGIYLPILG